MYIIYLWMSADGPLSLGVLHMYPYVLPAATVVGAPSGPCYEIRSVVRIYEQALVCLSNREIVDASRGCTFHCKMASNRFFL